MARFRGSSETSSCSLGLLAPEDDIERLDQKRLEAAINGMSGIGLHDGKCSAHCLLLLFG